MGWVTLTLRKTELKRTHSDYQMELLRISRTKRQMARSYHYEQSQVRSSQKLNIRTLEDSFYATRDGINEQIRALYENRDPQTGKVDEAQMQQLQQQLETEKLNFERQKNDMKDDAEFELAQIEEEANDTETQLDQEQVEIEAQLEAISQEIQAVGDAISGQIEASTIKLS